MKRQRIYVDTSVFGGCFDREFATWSVALMNDFRTGRYGLVVSDVTASEIDEAPEEVRDLYDELLNSAEELKVAPEALGLLRAYETQGVLPPRYRADMLHIALATVAEVDVLVSWNFSHIVRLDKIRLFNGISLQMGYKPLTIYSPREVATHEQED